MTYAIGKNVETCAAEICCQPAELETKTALVDDEGSIIGMVAMGYCLEHGIGET